MRRGCVTRFWLALGLNVDNADGPPVPAMLRQCCLNFAAVFFLWGSMDFLGYAASQRLIALFAGFLFHLELCGVFPH